MDQAPPSRQRTIGCVMSVGTIAAPFVALMFGFQAALVVLILALVVTSWFGWQALREAPQEHVKRLRIALLLNLVLVIAAIAVLGWMVR